MPSCAPVPTSGARLDRLVPPFGAKYERAPWRIESNDNPESPGRWLSGRKHPPAKRVGGVKLPHRFESCPPRHWHFGSKLCVWGDSPPVSETSTVPSAASLGIRSRDWSQAPESSSATGAFCFALGSWTRGFRQDRRPSHEDVAGLLFGRVADYWAGWATSSGPAESRSRLKDCWESPLARLGFVGPRITAVAIAAILLITSCTRGGPQAKASPGPTPLPSPSNIAWTSCGGFQCGTVQVPLDYAHPTNGDIGIALIKKPATNAGGRIGSLLTNPGGPDASGVGFLRSNASVLTGLNARFDLIGFDPRGIGASTPLRCLDGPSEDVFNALDPVLDDPTEKQLAIQGDKDFAAGCQQRSAKLLPFLDTPNAARDMDEIRP